jgi:hypothetical protein
LNLGDKKSKFFFNLVKGYHYHNKILSIHDENGMCSTNATEVKDTIVSYFEKLLGGFNSDLVLILLFFLRLFLKDYLPFKV